MTTHNPNIGVIFAGNAATALWWMVDQLARHGPSWELVPSILLATASVVGAARNWLDGAQARRFAAEDRARQKLLPRIPPGLERLN